jgi:signal transduction histidine kinase/ActR/RegA family two-component response regulator
MHCRGLPKTTCSPHVCFTVSFERWAQTSRSTALAIVENNAIRCSNARFQELDAGPWRWVSGSHVKVRYSSLVELVLGEAAGQASGLSRFERDGGFTIELRLESIGEEVVAMIADITQEVARQRVLQRDREALLHEERMRAMGVLASGVAHDLNHVLNIVALRVATLRADPALNGSKRTLDALSRVVAEAARVVARLQDLARKRRDRPIEPLDLAAVLTGAVEMARTEADLADVRIEADVPPLPFVRGSAAELAHVFGSLLAHAREQMPRGGMVYVRAREDHGRVCVTIRDSGAGLEQEDLTRLFDPFSGVAGDSSLGLSVAWGVMSRLGGQLSASSQPGEGTSFALWFPLAITQQRREPVLAPRPAQRLRRRILLVDDEADNLDVLREVLQLEGHDVEIARSGPEALARIDSMARSDTAARFDLVLCDVGMPEMSGWQVARELEGRTPRTPVWMLTGWANEIGDSDPRLRLVRGVLAKPLDLDRLRTLLAGSLVPPPEVEAAALH